MIALPAPSEELLLSHFFTLDVLGDTVSRSVEVVDALTLDLDDWAVLKLNLQILC